MKNIKTILLALLLFGLTGSVWGQETYLLKGKVLSDLKEPVPGAIVSVDRKNTTTGPDGTFEIEVAPGQLTFSVWAVDYFRVEQMINNRTYVEVAMVPENTLHYNESTVLPFREQGGVPASLSANLAKKDFRLGCTSIDGALAGQVAGLEVKRMSGMPGEGSYMNLRGLRSLTGDNAPLIVIDGAPYLPDKNESRILGGFTRDIFQAYNINDIQNITVLKGAETSIYGSMGANGVILIETDGARANDLQTQVSYYGSHGIAWNNKRLPMLAGSDYRNYLADAAMIRYGRQSTVASYLPFLEDPDDVKYAYLYNNATDWQDLLYQNAFVTDNLVRIEGGDEIAKYDFSLGYSRENGTLKETFKDRYHARFDASMVINSKLDISFSASLAYINTELQEQGMNHTTNPLLTAYGRSPVLSPYEKELIVETDPSGRTSYTENTLKTYSSYNFGISSRGELQMSNPLAIINTLDARMRQYDTSIRANVHYRPVDNLVLTGTFGMYYNYDNEHMFIPGLTHGTIVPVTDGFGTANNTVRDGVAEAFNMFYNANANYKKTFNGLHKFNSFAGIQVVTTKKEYDAGEGRNTPNDFYQTLGNTTSAQRFMGYLDRWNWLNVYAHADYIYNDQWQAAVNVSLDGASSTGTDVARHYLYPSFSAAWLGKGFKPLQDLLWLDRLTLRAEYGLTGNTRFSTNMGKYYYSSASYDQLSVIVRDIIPNQRLKPERSRSLNLTLDLAMWQNRFNLLFTYYDNQVTDMVMNRPMSSFYGGNPYYDNIGKMSNQGVELALQASLVRTRDFEWIVGGNIASYKNRVKSLGGLDQIVYQGLNGAQMITKVGESPYQFYGYRMLGVFPTREQADAANLTNIAGTHFQAGDVHFQDQNGDHMINDNDRVLLGSATPDYFGGFYTHFQYRSFSLSADFVYSVGNDAYNATRRENESMSGLKNQSKSVLNRWSIDGQVTDIPRIVSSDGIGNSAFSSRWIEDASYLRLRSVSVSYSFNRTLFNVFRSGTIYVTGENLLTFDKYLGLDPEFAYTYGEEAQGFDYAKLAIPRLVKVGLNLKF